MTYCINLSISAGSPSVLYCPLPDLAAIFAVANRAVTKIALHPLPFTAELPLYVIILGAIAIGLVIGVGLSSISRFRLKLESKKYQKRAEALKIVKKD